MDEYNNNDNNINWVNPEEENKSDISEIKQSSYYSESVKPKSNLGIKKILTIILVTSLLSSSIVGISLTYLFSQKINEQNKLLEKTGVVKNIDDVLSTKVSTKNDTSITENNYSSSTVEKIAKKAGPSIVGIKITLQSSNQNLFRDYGFDFNQPQSAEGSGIIISSEGYILTNYHVVKAADTKINNDSNTIVEVYLSDNRQAKAKFIGGDQETDLAVIQIDLDNLPTATLGDSSKLKVGELAVAIGNPLGLEYAGTVTTGVISALNREVDSELNSLKLIQTDAAINPGNSGGALLNSNGEVIGINSIKIAQTGLEGLGFAIPINDAKPVVEQLIKYGKVKGRPFIGITGEEITEIIAETYNLDVGILVRSILNDSGAEKAGIKRGDIIVELAGKKVKTMSELNEVKKEYKAGDTVNIKVKRDNGEVTLKLTFSEEE